MTKFTKGPWQVWGDWAIKDCTPAENLIGTFEPTGENALEIFANGRLMKAAPDMYSKLSELLTFLEVMHEADTSWTIKESSELHRETEALLKQIKGE